MSYNFNLPSIQGSTVEQLSQIRSYLYQIVPQLQWALNNLDASTVSSSTAQQVHQAKVAAATGSSSVSPQATFNAIKSLIITSADIVQAYFEEVDRMLSGKYFAESDFGTYIETTNQRITENSTWITQSFTNIQTVASDLIDMGNDVDDMSGRVSAVEGDVDDMSGRVSAVEGDVVNTNARVDDVSEELGGVASRVTDAENGLKDAEKYIIDTKASIKTGILYYLGDEGEEYDEEAKGKAVYGIEVGQTDKVKGVEVFSKYARFTSDRLAFYSKHSEHPVAYISDQKLYINDAEIKHSFQIGGYVDTVENGGVVTRWVGGNG